MNEPIRCETKPDPGSSLRRDDSRRDNSGRNNSCRDDSKDTSQTVETSRSRSAAFLPWLFAPAIILCLFGTCLFGVDRLAFRDVSHFYTPLYDYLDMRNDQQWVPLWNPLDQMGMPVLGETTTAALYPIRFAIYRLFDGHVAMAWYVVLHLIIAAITTVFAARRIEVGPVGQTIASSSYALSGSVLFLYTNPPFLVSAAWLPLAMSMLVDGVGTSVLRRAIIGGIAIALMVLGGDPQTALHCLMMTGIILPVRVFIRHGHRWKQDGMVLLLAPVLAGLLALPQIIASADWSRQSDRIEGIPAAEAYDFSVAPWHLLELFTHNAAGDFQPVNQRISSIISGDGRMWTPTIFMGLLTAWMMVDRLFHLRRTRYDRYLLIACVAFAFAIGNFGAYPVLYHFVPGYDSFRYPAKWLPLFALGMSMATADWFAELDWQKSRRSMWVIASLVGVGFLMTFLPHQKLNVRLDEFWGPLDFASAIANIRISILVSIAAVTLLGIAVRIRTRPSNIALALVLLVVGGHLFVSGRSMVWTVRIDQETRLVNSHLEPSPKEERLSTTRWLRTRSGPAWPVDWSNRSSHDRLLTVEASQQIARFGRWHLQDEVAVFNNFVSIRSREVDRFWLAVKELEEANADLDWAAIRRWLGMKGRLDQFTMNQGPGPIDGESMLTSRWIPDKTSGALVELHDQWHVVEASNRTDQQMVARLREVLAAYKPDGPERSMRPIILTDQDTLLSSQHPVNVTTSDFAIEVSTSESMIVQVKADQPVALLRNVFQDDLWHAEIRDPQDQASRWQARDVYAADFLKQAVILPRSPSGQWTVRFRYSPWWWVPSAMLACVAWIAVAMYLIKGSLVGNATNHPS